MTCFQLKWVKEPQEMACFQLKWVKEPQEMACFRLFCVKEPRRSDFFSDEKRYHGDPLLTGVI